MLGRMGDRGPILWSEEGDERVFSIIDNGKGMTIEGIAAG